MPNPYALIQELREAVLTAQRRTHQAHTIPTLPRVTAPCPVCNDEALLRQTAPVVRITLPDIFILMDYAVAEQLHYSGGFDEGPRLPRDHTFMGVTVVIASYPRGYLVCRGA